MTDLNGPLERLRESTEPLEQPLNQYVASLRHIDELLARAKRGAARLPRRPELQAQIEKATNERDRLSEHVDKLKTMSPDEVSEEIIGKVGPMGIWDAVANELEKVVERVEHK